MEKSLIDYLKEIPDSRTRRGCRHEQWLVILIIIMAIASGYWGYRGLGSFVERHRRELIKLLSIPQARVPSYSTIRRVMMGLDYEELAKAFNQWAGENGNLPNREWVSMDGKALKNTVTDHDLAAQNFVNVVSAFSHQQGIVMGVKVMENKHTSEIVTVRELLDILKVKGLVFTLDALHCQKKPLSRLSTVAMII
jgi:DDE_Tnp_1-associated